jgi:2-C-methyl-D-erythritol 2,4-cyclodiphosphate synthase
VRTGIGFDVHAFGDGRALVIGGVTIPGARGLDGHSDADVLCHAIADAVLGAGALGDIGQHFPSSEDRWRDAAGTDLLARAGAIAAEAGFAVVSVDATVVLEAPAIAEHRDEMRKRIASALGIDVDLVSVKATTTDGLGLVGRGEGAAALAVAVLAVATLDLR